MSEQLLIKFGMVNINNDTINTFYHLEVGRIFIICNDFPYMLDENSIAWSLKYVGLSRLDDTFIFRVGASIKPYTMEVDDTLTLSDVTKDGAIIYTLDDYQHMYKLSGHVSIVRTLEDQLKGMENEN